MSKTAWHAAVLATSCALAGIGPAAGETITTFDVSGYDTDAAAINAGGTVIGSYADRSGMTHGYVRSADGSISTFDPDKSTDTYPAAINSAGVITGWYYNNSYANGAQAFLRHPNGAITNIDVPDVIQTYPKAINDGGEITGDYQDKNFIFHAFVRGSDGTIVSFDFGQTTYPADIDAQGNVTGIFYSPDGNHGHGFLRAPDGTLTSFDVPNSMRPFVQAFNGKDKVVGWSLNLDGTRAAFERSPGKIHAFSVQGSTDTEAYDINAKGVITGTYAESASEYLGFVGSRKTGFTTFSVPAPGYTVPSSINDSGVIAGTVGSCTRLYCSRFKGFIRTP